MAFTITETAFGSHPALSIEGGAVRVVVSLRGVTVLSWNVDGVELIDGYADEVEFADQAGMRSAMMIPFSNRVRHGRYTFESIEHDLNEGDPEHSGETALHGILRSVDFTISETTVEESSAIVRFVSRALRPGAFPGYPFSVDVAINLTVTDRGLEFVATGSNTGDIAAPFATGWHPYFTIGTAPIEELVVSIPAETRIVPDDALIPLGGDAAREPLTPRLGHHQHIEQTHVIALDRADRHGHRPALVFDEGEACRRGDGVEHPLHGLAMLRTHRAVGGEGRDPARGGSGEDGHCRIGCEAVVQGADLQKAALDGPITACLEEAVDRRRGEGSQAPDRRHATLAVGCFDGFDIS